MIFVKINIDAAPHRTRPSAPHRTNPEGFCVAVRGQQILSSLQNLPPCPAVQAMLGTAEKSLLRRREAVSGSTEVSAKRRPARLRRPPETLGELGKISAARLRQGFAARLEEMPQQEKSGQCESIKDFAWGDVLRILAQKKRGQWQKPRLIRPARLFRHGVPGFRGNINQIFFDPRCRAAAQIEAKTEACKKPGFEMHGKQGKHFWVLDLRRDTRGKFIKLGMRIALGRKAKESGNETNRMQGFGACHHGGDARFDRLDRECPKMLIEPRAPNELRLRAWLQERP